MQCALSLQRKLTWTQHPRPRFDALGGDVARFFLLEGTVSDDGTQGRITLADVEQLEEAITDYKAKLVIIDPLQPFLGGDVDAHRANQTRPIFDGLIRLAEKLGCAILITRHLSKRARRERNISRNGLNRHNGSRPK